MKYLLLIIAVAGGYYAYGIYRNNPVDIIDPVYVESRVDVEIPQIGRELEYVFVGEMVSQQDCRKRSRRYLEKLLEACADCTIKQLHCTADLAKRYKKLFDGHTTYTTYLSFDKGNRFERNGRMVIWGLNEHEAKAACEHIKKDVRENYQGEVSCVAGRLS